MMKSPKKFVDHIVAFSLLIICYMSFMNTFAFAEGSWFKERTLWNDMLVYDGILNAKREQPFSSAYLGRYSRPLIKNRAILAKELFKNQNRDGVFKTYKSQYGLQVKIFSWLNHKGLNINGLEKLNALLLSILVCINYLILRFCGFKNLPSAAFSSSFFLNPWLVSLAKSLYWSPVTWFIPASSLVLFLIYSNYKKKENDTLFFLVAYTTFLVRFLCGYEYLTTIALFSICSLIIISKKLNLSLRYILKKIIFIIFACIFSFSTALIMHSQYLESIGVDSRDFISMRANANLTSTEDKEIAEYMCSLNESDGSCLDIHIKKSKEINQANVFSVLGRYFFIPRNLPWIYYKADQISIDEKKFIRGKLNSKNILVKLEGLNYLSKNYLDILIKSFFNRSSFLFINITIFFLNRKNKEIKYCLFLMALPPISWFTLAKGHSYIHFHLNYVLWSIGYIPTLAYVLTYNLRKILKTEINYNE